MGRPSEGKSPVIRYLWPHHRSLARAVVAGLKPMELSQIYGFTPSHITRIINSPAFLAEVARLEEDADDKATDVRADIKKMARRAVEVLDEQLNRPGVPEQTRQRAAFDVLDRAGFGAKPTGLPGGSTFNFTKIEKIVQQSSPEHLKDDVLDLLEVEPSEDGEEDEEELLKLPEPEHGAENAN